MANTKKKAKKVERRTLYHLYFLGFEDIIEGVFLFYATPAELRKIEAAMDEMEAWADKEDQIVSFKCTPLPDKKSTPTQVLRAMAEYREEVERENEPDESIIKD